MGSPADPARIRRLVSEGAIRLSKHAEDELVEDGFSPDDLLGAFETSQLVEDYPDAQRGSCCLLFGIALDGRPLRIVCTSGGDLVIVITVYRPTPPRWPTPWRRGDRG